MLNRRSFVKSSLAGGVALASIGTLEIFNVACNSASVLADVEKFEPIVINALVLACAISPAAPICGTMQQTITNDYNTVVTLWTDWNKAVAAGTSTSALWNDLNAAFTVFEEDASLIFSLALGLNAPEVTAIVAAAQVLLAAIEALFPDAPKGSTAFVSKKFAKSGLSIPLKGSSPKQQKDWFNAWAKDYNGKVEVAQKLHPKVKLHKVNRYFFPF